MLSVGLPLSVGSTCPPYPAAHSITSDSTGDAGSGGQVSHPTGPVGCEWVPAPRWAASTGGTQWPPKPLQPLHVPSVSHRTQPSCPQVLPLSGVTVWCAAGQRCTTFAFPEFLIGNPCAPRSLSCYFFCFSVCNVSLFQSHSCKCSSPVVCVLQYITCS